MYPTPPFWGDFPHTWRRKRPSQQAGAGSGPADMSIGGTGGVFVLEQQTYQFSNQIKNSHILYIIRTVLSEQFVLSFYGIVKNTDDMLLQIQKFYE